MGESGIREAPGQARTGLGSSKERPARWPSCSGGLQHEDGPPNSPLRSIASLYAGLLVSSCQESWKTLRSATCRAEHLSLKWSVHHRADWRIQGRRPSLRNRKARKDRGFFKGHDPPLSSNLPEFERLACAVG